MPTILGRGYMGKANKANPRNNVTPTRRGLETILQPHLGYEPIIWLRRHANAHNPNYSGLRYGQQTAAMGWTGVFRAETQSPIYARAPHPAWGVGRSPHGGQWLKSGPNRVNLQRIMSIMENGCLDIIEVFGHHMIQHHKVSYRHGLTHCYH